MRILLIGATGNIGSKILKEAIERKNDVVALLRNPEKLDSILENVENNRKVEVVQGDVNDLPYLIDKLDEIDVIISALAPDGININSFVDLNKKIIEASKKINRRLIVVGGAGSLLLEDGKTVIEAGYLAKSTLPIAEIHNKVLEELYIPSEDLNWTVFSPSLKIETGKRTRIYNLESDNLVVNEQGESKISYEDFAVAILDEIENKKYKNARFTIGY